MRTHYYPNGLARYDSDGHDFVEQGPCGTWLGENSDLSGDWNRVDCKRCLKKRPAITASSEAERQEQGEVQMLREALEHCLEVMKDPWKHGEGCISRAINRADAALAASTGQAEGGKVL